MTDKTLAEDFVVVPNETLSETAPCLYCKKQIQLTNLITHQEECKTASEKKSADPFADLNPFKPEEKLQKMMEEQNKLVAQASSPSPSPQKEQRKLELSPCPICSKSFPISEIENHVNNCLDSGPEEVPLRNNTQENKNKPENVARPQQPQQQVSSPKLSAPQNSSAVQGQNPPQDEYLVAQKQSLEFWEKKAMQEEEDRKVALLLMEQEKQRQANNAPPSSVQDPFAKQEEEDRKLALKLMEDEKKEGRVKLQSSVEEDRNIAMMILEQERKREAELKRLPEEQDQKLAKILQQMEREEMEKLKKEKEELDKRIAEQLWKQEQEAEEERKQKEKAKKDKEELERTISLIRQEAKSEADAQLAKLVREKEELLRQIQNLNNNYDPERTVSISLQGVTYPQYWDHQYSDYQVFQVANKSQEWRTIVAHFKKGLPQARIQKIERIQNRTLWTFYFLKNQMISNKNGFFGNEQYLFHGSRTDAYDTIIKEGFDHRVANLNGAIGAGIYFATSSSTSSGYVNSSSYKRMLYCKVTLGKVGPGQSGLRRPPPLPGSRNQLYDSVGNSTMYVIFDNEQAYPEYVIYYN